ncbi:MAG: diguanylate cyclase [Zhongshania sp.]|nr:diguanylate cyclase [Zhongshania sp.]
MWTSATLNKVIVFHLVVAIGIVVWTGILFALYLWAVDGEHDHLTETIKLKAESMAQNSQSLRSWVGGHGGVYVEVNDKIKPNPLLANMPERDIETPSGRKLTLFNSPAFLREISQTFESSLGDRIKLISYQPLNPANTPDDWEKKALKELEAGAATAQGFVSGEKSHFRLMYPMMMEAKCAKCHRYLKDIPRNVVGGLSVMVDKTPYDRLSEKVIRKITTGYFSIWLIGLFGLIVFDFKGAKLLRNIQFTATHDGLTQLNNRREIECLINLECERADRYKNPLSVMMLDIDYFKRVNDTYGHQVGDEALRVVATTIKQTIRKIDIAGRYGGEEFLVLTPDTPREKAEILAQRLNKAIKTASIKLKDGKTFSVTVSIGGSCFSPERRSADLLVKSADEALYKAKETGRDRVCFSK